MIAALLGLVAGWAWAHGPAPSPLQVVAWAGADEACGLEVVPDVARTNIGVLFRDPNSGTYRYGCPSRWGDAEAALVAPDPTDRERWLVASATGAWWVSERGCRADPVDLTVGSVVLGVAWGARAWLATRVDGGVEVRSWPGGEAVALGPGLWRGMAADGERVVVGLDDELVGVSDGVVRRWRLIDLEGDPLALQVTAMRGNEVAGRWSTPEGERVGVVRWGEPTVAAWPELEPAVGLVLGPVRRAEGFAVAVDGVYVGPEGVRDATGWTFLGVDAPAFGRLGEVWRADGEPQRVFTMDQIDPPDAACPDPTRTCALDWAHFGGESGWLERRAARCPGEERRPIEAVEPEARACGVGGGVGQGWGAIALLLGLGRRRGVKGGGSAGSATDDPDVAAGGPGQDHA